MKIEQLVNDSWRVYGEAVTRTLVLSFGLKYGSYSPESIAAKTALSKLTGEPYSPSEDTVALIREAAVSIPNQRSSKQSRLRGRSVD